MVGKSIRTTRSRAAFSHLVSDKIDCPEVFMRFSRYPLRNGAWKSTSSKAVSGHHWQFNKAEEATGDIFYNPS
jgi:hypothetical protein